MKVADIRHKFLTFFEQEGHSVRPSSSLVPHNDPTLLFTNSGMVQFKDVFLGAEKAGFSRATTAQRCLRAGGKHNDLENVGYTARHHTFFEMLGNFSFGDYFKRDAIHFAWKLLTQTLGLPSEKLWVTVYADDDEAYAIWRDQIKVPEARIVRIGDNKGARYASDNFWQMADTGPCGPCSEIFYDHGPDVAGGPPGSPEADGDRYIEIWNLVFMQFERDEGGQLHPLPRPCVDTGMGLERIAAVLQGVHSNYEIDLFQHLIKAVAAVTGCKNLADKSLYVIADHIRASAFLVVDGVIPGNEGRGYVLRRIIRRAIRHGYKLGMRAPFFYRLLPTLVEEMGVAYPDLKAQAANVEKILRMEEERFFITLENGMEILNQAIAGIGGSLKNGVLDGLLAFRLHDTYGFPLDLTADVCREQGLSVDEEAFNQAMAGQRDMAREAGKFKASKNLSYSGVNTAFTGYGSLAGSASVQALYREGSQVADLQAGERAVVVLDQTPFYAESGGQVGDSGRLVGAGVVFEVEDTQKIAAQVFGHYGVLRSGSLAPGVVLTAEVNAAERAATARHHSATHLLHHSLRAVLGRHVQQKGSLVDSHRTRFDFSHSEAVRPEQLLRIEEEVNAAILANSETAVRQMSYDAAIKAGAVALFGEKYGDEVRVLNIGPSCELCGGTHVARSGDIGFFKIVAESGVAAGIRRIEAVCGLVALKHWQDLEASWGRVSAAAKSNVQELPARIAEWRLQIKASEDKLRVAQQRLAALEAREVLAKVQPCGGLGLLQHHLAGADAGALRQFYDALKPELKQTVLLLSGGDGGSETPLLAAVGEGVSISAKEVLEVLLAITGGKGGGRPDRAQGVAQEGGKLSAAIAALKARLGSR